MKIVVQNSIQHCLSMRELEAMVMLFPASWSRRVKTILLGQNNEIGITINFHPKAQSIFLACNSHDVLPSKRETIEALLVALMVIDDMGGLPNKISASLRSHCSEITSKLAQSCLELTEPTKTLNSISS